MPPPQKPVRPPVLTVFLVLSFIGVGFALLSALISIGLYAAAPDLARELNMPDPNYGVLAGGLLFAVGKLVGAVQMWKLKKIGFMFYTICEIGNVVLTIFNTVVAQREAMDVYGSLADVVVGLTVLFTVAMGAVWIGVYASQRKVMS